MQPENCCIVVRVDIRDAFQSLFSYGRTKDPNDYFEMPHIDKRWEIRICDRNTREPHKIFSEITCTALVSFEKFGDKKELEKIILIKIPAEIYPTLYDTFVYLFNQAGIKNIQIDKKVDFEKLYRERK